jgi:alkanesulfonate monooxygenase SsuD/methylene tetrahydromethanopterin reductase-like flavin-dependent oxidoreductase (luciferase family)
MYEAYPTLGFIAAHTRTALLHTLVTGVIYRELALLAKAITTLDVLSGGRAGLGIGAAWNVEESGGLGFRFPTTKERFDRLEEAIQICLQLWSDSEEPYDGTYYRLGRTLDAPGPLRRPYLMIGGVGEKRTLRMVAQYADACNLFTDADPPASSTSCEPTATRSAVTTTRSRRRCRSPSTPTRTPTISCGRRSRCANSGSPRPTSTPVTSPNRRRSSTR